MSTGAVVAIRLRALGDLVLTTPALRALKRGHPDRPLEVVTEPRFAPLLAGLPEVDRVWSLERTTAATVGLVAALRRRGVGVAVDFFGNPRSAVVAAGCGARHSAGYDLRGRGWAYRVRVPREQSPGPGRREYAAATHVRLARAAGGIDDGIDARVICSPADREAGARVLAAAGIQDAARTIGLVAAGTWPTKTWPLSHAAELARRLMAVGREVLHLVGPGEEGIAARLDALAPGVRRLPPCGLRELIGVIASLAAVVGTDSGPRHLAAALGVPTVSWFGPTHPDTWSPPGPLHDAWRTPLPCAACDRTACPHWNCMPGLTPAAATARVTAHLERHGR